MLAHRYVIIILALYVVQAFRASEIQEPVAETWIKATKVSEKQEAFFLDCKYLTNGESVKIAS